MPDANVAELAKDLADTKQLVFAGQTALNIVWTLITGYLVMFMQAGFALVETGLTRAKNVAHTMGMNLLVYAICVLAFWVMGFALQMGGVGSLASFGNDATLSREFVINVGGHDFGLFGMHGFFLSPAVYTAPVAALFLFQMVFMDTAVTIPTGAMAERWRFWSFVAFSFVLSSIGYPIFANWVWGGGWLSQLGKTFGLGHGHVDFAGSSVVHMVGGVASLVGAKILGPRIGKYGVDGKPRPIPAHNIPMVVLGTFILAFGAWGVISLGLFADGRYGDGWNGVPGPVRGLFYGDPGQLGAECIGALSCFVWVGAVTFVAFKVLGFFMRHRSSAEDERSGLDVPELGIEGYATEVAE
jgi:Amt family ammonium transporter